MIEKIIENLGFAFRRTVSGRFYFRRTDGLGIWVLDNNFLNVCKYDITPNGDPTDGNRIACFHLGDPEFFKKLDEDLSCD